MTQFDIENAKNNAFSTDYDNRFEADIETKKCKRCLTDVDIDEFSLYLDDICIDCQEEYAKEQYTMEIGMEYINSDEFTQNLFYSDEDYKGMQIEDKLKAFCLDDIYTFMEWLNRRDGGK